CLGQDRGRATEFTARMVADAITAVQALVDLTVAALPVPVIAAPALAVPTGTTMEVAFRVPGRPQAWIERARRRAVRRRVCTVLVTFLIVATFAAATVASFVAGERDAPRSQLDVMARAHGLSDLPASAH